jgi:hypothetical protein
MVRDYRVTPAGNHSCHSRTFYRVKQAPENYLAKDILTMKWTIENGAKIFGLFSFCLLAMAAAHDWAFFAAFGAQFQSIQTTYDYISGAIEWLPALLFFIAVINASQMFMMAVSRGEENDPGFMDQRQKKNSRVYRRFAIIFGFMTVVLGLGGFLLFTSWERRMFAGGSFVMLAATVLMWFRSSRDTTKWEPIVISIYGALLVLAMAYIFGAYQGELAKEGQSRVYTLKTKEGPARDLILIRSIEKGILTWDAETNTAEFIRWDGVATLSRVSEPQRSVVCSWLNKLC